MMWLAGLSFLVVLFVPAHAWAWGPITHLVHGSEMLSDLTILGLSLQRLLHRYRLEYLYGCIGADITQAKKYTRAQQAHCHSWTVGWALLERARTDAQRAFAYGYLTHLAGDVYSHNHFVPTQLIVSFRARTLRHIYWEARFDSLQHQANRTLIRELRDHRFRECDALVKEVVSRTLFSFRTDKQIFNGFIAVHDLAQWHRIMRRLTVRSRYALAAEIVQRYNGACHGAITDVLQHGKRADCQSADPTGLEAINLAKAVRRMLKGLERRGQMSEKLEREIATLDERRELETWPGTPGMHLSFAH
jgi:Zinc dependent phospholipase C